MFGIFICHAWVNLHTSTDCLHRIISGLNHSFVNTATRILKFYEYVWKKKKSTFISLLSKKSITWIFYFIMTWILIHKYWYTLKLWLILLSRCVTFWRYRSPEQTWINANKWILPFCYIILVLQFVQFVLIRTLWNHSKVSLQVQQSLFLTTPINRGTHTQVSSFRFFRLNRTVK